MRIMDPDHPSPIHLASSRPSDRPDDRAEALHAPPPERPVDDDLGARVHVAAAVLAMFALPLAPAPNSIAFILLLIVTVVRLRQTLPQYARVVGDPLGWLIIAWVAWHAITLLWSSDPAQGVDELVTFRVLALPLLLWPVMHRAVWLIVAFLLGVFVQNLVQFGQGVELLPRDFGDGDRLRGLLHPIRTASMCLTAMIWHLTATLIGRGWVRWLSLLGLGVAGLGLVATGSRGPWIAAAIAMPLALLVIALRRPSTRLTAGALAVTAVAGVMAFWPIGGDLVQQRFERAMDDLEQIADGRYRSDVGIRVLSWRTAWEIFLEHPLRGVGAGGFREASVEADESGVLDRRQPDHAHSLYMQVLACTGMPGVVLFASIVVLALIRAWRAPPSFLYADATMFILIAWLIAACFDADHLTSHTFGVFAFMIALLAARTIRFQPNGFLGREPMNVRTDHHHGIP